MEDFPKYGDLVSKILPSGTVQPSAPPPLDNLPPPSDHRPLEGAVDYTEPESRPEEQGLTFQDKSRTRLVVDAYVRYSMAHHLRKYMTPKSDRLDPELDVEAKFSRRAVRSAQSDITWKEKLRCLAGWMWCFGIFLVALYVLVPLAMLFIGGVGSSRCSYKSSALIVYLLLGGILVLVMVCMRSIPSLMNAFKDRKCCRSHQDSFKFTAFICLCEIGFYVVAVGNVAFLLLGSVWIFQGGRPTFCSSKVTDNCCSFYVYVSSGFFNLFQYLLYAVTLAYTCSVFCCIRVADKGSRRRNYP